jgi:hypothetical protein
MAGGHILSNKEVRIVGHGEQREDCALHHITFDRRVPNIPESLVATESGRPSNHGGLRATQF